MDKSARRRRGRLSIVRDVAIVVVGALLVSTLLRVFVVQLFEIPSESMANTLMVGDRIAVQKMGGVQRGDIVVFTDELDWLEPEEGKEDEPAPNKVLVFLGLAPDNASEYLVKRVIGVAGDHLVCCDAESRIMINGVSVDAAEYLYTNPITGEQDDPSIVKFDVIVPQGGLFVVGDHRADSEDSRYHLCQAPEGDPLGSRAIVPESAVVGTVAAIVLPLSRFDVIDRPAVFADLPGPAEPAPVEPIISRTSC